MTRLLPGLAFSILTACDDGKEQECAIDPVDRELIDQLVLDSEAARVNGADEADCSSLVAHAQVARNVKRTLDENDCDGEANELGEKIQFADANAIYKYCTD